MEKTGGIKAMVGEQGKGEPDTKSLKKAFCPSTQIFSQLKLFPVFEIDMCLALGYVPLSPPLWPDTRITCHTLALALQSFMNEK